MPRALPKPPIELEVGERCNVRRAPYEPKIREVISTGWQRRKDGLWFCWRWKPEGGRDCGYSGLRVKEAT